VVRLSKEAEVLDFIRKEKVIFWGGSDQQCNKVFQEGDHSHSSYYNPLYNFSAWLLVTVVNMLQHLIYTWKFIVGMYLEEK
jgi:ABC-type cobalt transport system substrate-binding protein